VRRWMGVGRIREGLGGGLGGGLGEGLGRGVRVE
jgi:hypothetical protein